MYAERLTETLPRVRDAIGQASARAGRSPDEITLVAVTKGHPLAACEAALGAGLRDLGENRIGELEEKVEALGREGVRWHMVGHLQRRKAPRAIEVADLIHSVDSLRLAERLDRVQDDDRGVGVEVLLQVNTSGEEAKYGFDGEREMDRLLEAAELPGLRVRGLMTMAPYTDDETVLRRTFSRLRELLVRIRKAEPDVGSELSMGMTNDLRIAVAEGSTMVRIGTALFGERS